MPKPALSLVGYLDEPKAFDYLQKQCLLTDSSPQSLREAHDDAISKLGPAIENAGNPEMIDIPAVHQNYVNLVKSNPATTMLEMQVGRSPLAVQLVEIAPLLAFQIHIELERADNFYQKNETTPTVEEMLVKCLPLQGNENILVSGSQPVSPHSWMVRTQSLNFRPYDGGLFMSNGEHYFGVKVGLANPLVQVQKFQGRCYLINGFHRAFCFGKAGAKYLPCIVQEAQTLNGVPLSFPLERLQSENPPTLGHFLNDRAYPVQLCNYNKYMTVTFAEHVFYEE